MALKPLTRQVLNGYDSPQKDASTLLTTMRIPNRSHTLNKKNNGNYEPELAAIALQIENLPTIQRCSPISKLRKLMKKEPRPRGEEFNLYVPAQQNTLSLDNFRGESRFVLLMRQWRAMSYAHTRSKIFEEWTRIVEERKVTDDQMKTLKELFVELSTVTRNCC
ncbi:hypothetical protein G7Y89_g12135 [Cudoniella acicularis]|uniref:Uncharacterized protein n=1 Tax=Cudoniella acicularis TaxID=354080 RepID=A0A8H4VX82_9HELO|nr:hypothetical protein G7Y89_g12135 [Cudoniella acicularis]